jgi:Caspase domain
MMPVLSAHAEGRNHLLTIAVCPDWKHGANDEQTALMRGACKTAVEVIETSFQGNMSVDNDNTYHLLDENATYADVEQKMAWINDNTNPEDTVFIYLLAHGGEIQGHYKGYPVSDQGIALWSEEEPDIATATDQKVWMLARTFRDMMDGIKVENIVLIIDSCHSGAAFNDFRDDPHHQSADGKRTAIIFSSQEDQFANFNAAYTLPVFTEIFAHTLNVSVGEPFSDAFFMAQAATHRRMRYNCENPETQSLIAESPSLSHYSLCTQMAVLFDPRGLLDDIKVK